MTTTPSALVRRALLVAAVLLVGMASAASAWVHPLQQVTTYYYPGPPPGGFLSGCIVQSELGKQPSGDWARIRGTYSGASPFCARHTAHVITLNQGTGQLEYGAGPNAAWHGAWATSVGQYGQPVFGATLTETSTAGLYISWNISLL